MATFKINFYIRGLNVLGKKIIAKYCIRCRKPNFSSFLLLLPLLAIYKLMDSESVCVCMCVCTFKV